MRRALALSVLFACVGCDASSPSLDGGGRDAARADGGSSGGDAGTPSDGGALADGGGLEDAAVAPDGGTVPCSDPPGSACNPIPIDAFPFRHAGDTAASGEDALDAYACAPGTDEGGPEVHYALTTATAQRFTFTIEETSGVDVDVHVLRAPEESACLARANTTLEQPLGAGTWRVIVDTFRAAGTDQSGAYTLLVDAAAPAPSAPFEMWNTFYFLADEDEHEGAQDTPIYDASCNELARVRQSFHDSVCIEGSGRLADDRLINYATTCTDSCPAARTCGGRAYRICYSVLDPTRYPWGQGAGGRSLVPDVSIAIDRAFVPLGEWIFFEELAGLVPPGETTPHSGCMRTDDVGGGIDGNQFDFFAGTRPRWLAWETQIPTRTTFTATRDDPRCYPRP